MRTPKKYYTLTAFALYGILFSVIWIGLLLNKSVLSYFNQSWQRIALFIAVEVLILAGTGIFAVWAGRVLDEHQRQMAQKWENEIKYRGIKPGDYTYVWFDGDLDYTRALIMPAQKGWLMYVQEYDEHIDDWCPAYDKELRFETIDELKEFLAKEHNFIVSTKLAMEVFAEFKRSKLAFLFDFDEQIAPEFSERDENCIYLGIKRNGKLIRVDIDEQELYMEADGGANKTVNIDEIPDMNALASLVKNFILSNS